MSRNNIKITSRDFQIKNPQFIVGSVTNFMFERGVEGWVLYTRHPIWVKEKARDKKLFFSHPAPCSFQSPNDDGDDDELKATAH
jgi:hypothetical protein